MNEINYNFDENTQPKEIIYSVLIRIDELLKSKGFNYLKSKSKFIKKTKKFTYTIYSQSNRWNSKGNSAEIILHCSVLDTENKTQYWGKTLAISNSKKDQMNWWNFYGKVNYTNNLKQITNIITLKLIPFFNEFENNLKSLVDKTSDKGFCVFSEKQVYDAGFYIPIKFLDKYGTKEQLNIAFQHYIDRHELVFVKQNMKKAIELIKEGNEVKNNGEKSYAKFVVENGLELQFG